MRRVLVVGLVLFSVLIGFGSEWLRSRPPPPPARPTPVFIRKWTLNGPGGDRIDFPPTRPSVINAFLQGCKGCGPAFLAWRDQTVQELGPETPVLNVALGTVSLEWARAWKLDRNLVVDISGTVVFTPASVEGFETLVVDEEGVVRLRDRPDLPGFSARVRGALAALQRPGQ